MLHGHEGAVGREARCRDAVPNANLRAFVIFRVQDDSRVVDLGDARDVQQGGDFFAELVVEDLDVDGLYAEECPFIEGGGRYERQLVGGLASGHEWVVAVVGLGVLGLMLHEHGRRADHGSRHARGSRDHDEATTIMAMTAMSQW